MSSFGQKKREIFLRVSALKNSIQKTFLYSYVKQSLISVIKCIYVFDPISFYRLGMKSLKKIVGFLVESMTSKIPLEINWPLLHPNFENSFISIELVERKMQLTRSEQSSSYVMICYGETAS